MGNHRIVFLNFCGNSVYNCLKKGPIDKLESLLVKPQVFEVRFFAICAYSKYILDALNSENRAYLLTILYTVYKTMFCVRKRNV